MPEVHVLIEGYYTPGPPVRAVATTTLVTGDGWAWVVDPGSAPAEQIVAALAQRQLAPADVDTLFLTHAHLDHTRHAGLFTRARVLDAWGWWEGDVWREFDGALPAGLTLLPTPGHSADLLTLLVHTGRGCVAICGDVFFHETLLTAEDPFAEDAARLAISRQQVLARADAIIPGHGPLFRVRR